MAGCHQFVSLTLTAKSQYRKFEKKELSDHSPNFHIHVSERFMYSQDLYAYPAAGKYVDR